MTGSFKKYLFIIASLLLPTLQAMEQKRTKRLSEETYLVEDHQDYLTISFSNAVNADIWEQIMFLLPTKDAFKLASTCHEVHNTFMLLPIGKLAQRINLSVCRFNELVSQNSGLFLENSNTVHISAERTEEIVHEVANLMQEINDLDSNNNFIAEVKKRILVLQEDDITKDKMSTLDEEEVLDKFIKTPYLSQSIEHLLNAASSNRTLMFHKKMENDMIYLIRLVGKRDVSFETDNIDFGIKFLRNRKITLGISLFISGLCAYSIYNYVDGYPTWMEPVLSIDQIREIYNTGLLKTSLHTDSPYVPCMCIDSEEMYISWHNTTSPTYKFGDQTTYGNFSEWLNFMKETFGMDTSHWQDYFMSRINGISSFRIPCSPNLDGESITCGEITKLDVEKSDASLVSLTLRFTQASATCARDYWSSLQIPRIGIGISFACWYAMLGYSSYESSCLNPLMISSSVLFLGSLCNYLFWEADFGCHPISPSGGDR